MIRTEIVIAFLTLIVIGASLVLFFHLHPQNTPISEPALAPSTTPAVAASTTELILPAVSLEEKIGQLIMIGHWADKPLASTTELITKNHLGSVIIMSAPEVASTTLDWVATWQAVSSSTLLIGVDQEGGPVTRYKDGFIQTSQREINDTATAYEVG
ncbi:hypothetical protein H6778_03770, partial [Candidatus Nomurabacteria bacterium]|nr:hypothetical protein [Candidatus Nomurabacteria bacterium]